MSEIVRVAVDAMGGDDAPAAVVLGAVNAVNNHPEINVTLVGVMDAIEAELAKYKVPAGRIDIKAASEVIDMAEPPVVAIRKKKDSSIVVGLNLIKTREADAFVSAGSTGAILVGGQLIAGRIPDIKRAPLAPLIPTLNGVSLLIDCGANVDARSEHLVQFARMGSIYMQNIMNKKRPRVAIVNIGAEEEKGNALVKETYPLLKECKDILFIGSIEARDIPKGKADVIVCEAFVGNVILKLYEGTGQMFLSSLKKGLTSSLLSKLGAALVLPSLKKTLKDFDTKKYGGAPLLGLNGLVVKAHGSSGPAEIENAIVQCISFKQQDISTKISQMLQV